MHVEMVYTPQVHDMQCVTRRANQSRTQVCCAINRKKSGYIELSELCQPLVWSFSSKIVA